MSNLKRPRVSLAVLLFSTRHRALALSLAALATGCGAGDVAESPVEGASQSLSSLPATCQDVKAANPQAPDGFATLYVGGDASMPWTAWCQNMAGTPSEYLALARTGADANFAQYTAGGYSSGTTARTTYTRLRIDPTTLRVSTADQTFSTSVGAVNHGSTRVTAMPYGVAMMCSNTGLAPANLDLRGTPFAVAPGQFAVGGSSARGGAVYSASNQVVSLLGGGTCGWDAPAGSFNPFNQSGAQLQLQYRAANRAATCQDIKTANPQAVDGEYTLYVDQDPLKPWSAWCQNMAGTPAEYLMLVQTGTSNYSQYTAGGNSPGTDVRTTYTRLRLDPVTLRVNTADQTFSTTTGSLQHGGDEPVTSMPYAAAMGCSQWGVGNVDLRGTPFAVASGQFMIGGLSTGGSSHAYGAGNQVVGLSAYGGCGWVAPLGSFNPFNQNGMPLLLVYSGAL
jgi:hypothetical protein